METFWTPAGLAGRAGVSLATLRRWKRTGRTPKRARVLIALLSGELDLVDPAFTGWIIRQGELVSPEGWRFSPGEIRSIPLLYGQISLWRGEARALQQRPTEGSNMKRRTIWAALAAVFLFNVSGCATIEEHPVASAAAVAFLGASIALSADHDSRDIAAPAVRNTSPVRIPH